MVARRFVLLSALLLATAVAFFTLGTIHSRRHRPRVERAAYDAKLDAIRAELL